MAINLEAAFSTVVHTVPSRARVETSFATVVSTGHPATAAVVSNTPGTGPVSTPFTFFGSSSIADTWAWTFTSVPAGSAVPVGITAFPDSGATTPVDMTDNEVLLHFEPGALEADTSGNAVTFTNVNATQGTGVVGSGGLVLNGSNAYLTTTAGADANLRITGDMSFAAWIKPDTIATSDRIIVFGAKGETSATNQLYGIWFRNSSGDLRYFHESGAGVNTQLDSNVRITSGSWSHFVFVRDTAAKSVTMYVDGVAQQTMTYSDNPDGGTDGYLVVGGDVSVGSYLFDGEMDELAVWSRALSATEIANIYDLQIGVYARTEDITFTPDVEGTYTVQLAVTGYDLGVAATDSTSATFSTGTPAAADPGFLTGFLAGFFDEDKFT